MRRWLLFLVGLLLLVGVALGVTYWVFMRPNTERVVLRSDIAGYGLVKTRNFSQFLQYLDRIGFWLPQAVVSTDGRTKLAAKKLFVVLTNVSQDSAPVTKDEGKTILTSFGYVAEIGDVTLFLYVDPLEINRMDANMIDTVNQELMRATFLISHHDPVQYQETMSAANELIRDLYRSPFVQVRRNQGSGWWSLLWRKVTPIAYAADCAFWKCGVIDTTGTCEGNGATCKSDAQCGPINGPCNFPCVLPEYNESAQSCSPGCPAGRCIRPGSYTCSCAAPTPTPTCAPSSCTPACGQSNGCGGFCPSTDVGNYGGWSSCSNSCGSGTQTRSDSCGNTQSQSCCGDNGTTTYGAWTSCSGSPATKSRTVFGCCSNSTQTVNCTGTINSRAVQVSSLDFSCATINGSTTGVSGTVHQFSPASASTPSAQTQSGANYVTFSNIVGGTYNLVQTPPADYVARNVCWTKVLNTPAAGSSMSETLSEPIDTDTLTWNVGYTLGTPWFQVQGGDVYSGGKLQSYVGSSASPRKFLLDGSGGYPGIASYGSDYDFDSSLTSQGDSLLSSQGWLVEETHPTKDWYTAFWRRFGGPLTVDYDHPLTPSPNQPVDSSPTMSRET